METRRISILDHGFVELLDSMGNDLTIVNAARVSFLGESKGEEQDSKLIKYLIQNKHTSPLEQVEFQFRVKCPLFIARQWMRHRTWNYNEISRRYTSEEIEFYIPTELRKQADNNRQASTEELVTNDVELYDPGSGKYYSLCSPSTFISLVSNSAYQQYQALLRAGVAREQARMILPQNMYTMFYAKVDLHNLLHFIELRNSEHAQYEVRLYAQALEDLIKDIVPVTYKYWKELICD